MLAAEGASTRRRSPACSKTIGSRQPGARGPPAAAPEHRVASPVRPASRCPGCRTSSRWRAERGRACLPSGGDRRWRGLLGRPKPIELVGLFGSGGEALDRRTAEAADFAREALEGARNPAAAVRGPDRNRGAQLRPCSFPGRGVGTRDLLESAIGHPSPRPGSPFSPGTRGCLHEPRAHRDRGRARRRGAGAARKAVAFARPGSSRDLAGSGSASSRSAERVQAAGREGTATLRSSRATALLARRRPDDFSVYAAALNTAARTFGTRRSRRWPAARTSAHPRDDPPASAGRDRRRARSSEGSRRPNPSCARSARSRGNGSADRETFDGLDERGRRDPGVATPRPAHEEIVIAWWNALGGAGSEIPRVAPGASRKGGHRHRGAPSTDRIPTW
jgi:hypothetical protein